MKQKVVFLCLAIVFCSLSLQATSTQSGGSWYTSYNLTLNAGQTDISNIMLLENSQDGSSMTWAFGTNCGGDSCTTTINNPFAFSSLPTTALLIGLTNGGQDAVLITNTSFAGNASWDSLFPGFSESDFISNLALATSGQDWPIIQPGLDYVGSFWSANQSLNFNINSGSFNVWEFSDGELVGSGTSSVSYVPPVPEPGSLALLGTGLLSVAGVIRRKLVNKS